MSTILARSVGRSVGRSVPGALIAALAGLTTLVASPRAIAAPYCYNSQWTNTITSRQFYLAEGTTARFRTQNLTYTYTDPVMHLLGPDGHEVARNDDYAPPDRNARIDYPVPAGGSGTYTVIVRNYMSSSWGSGDLQKCTGSCTSPSSWSTIVYGGSFSGTFLAVPSNLPMYQTAEINDGIGGTSDTVLAGLAGTGDVPILDWDDDGAVAHMSGLIERPGFPHAGINYLLVGGYEADGYTSVYANDSWTDTDGDYLGAMLEQCVGTCDTATTHAYCAGKDGWQLRDSDRDGLDDYIEIFGGYETPGLSDADKFPAWGASPLRKDIFVEFDWANLPNDTVSPPASPVAPCAADLCWPSTISSTPMTEAIASSIRDRLDTPGTSWSLQNLQQLDGVGFHADIGRPCPNNPLVCGAWGGGGQRVAPPPAARSMAARRDLTFRYALLYPAGGVSLTTPSNGFNVGVSAWDTTPASPSKVAAGITHELGHSIGLHHWGHDSWGRLNCMPNYVSIMNYHYGWQADDATPWPATWRAGAFSKGGHFGGRTLNPTGVSESELAGYDASYMAGAPFEYPSAYAFGDVDFNRSGGIEGGLFRAGLTGARGECGIPTEQADLVAVDAATWTAGTQTMLGVPYQLETYVIDYSRTFVGRYTAAHAGPTNGASCDGPYGSKVFGTCHTWAGVGGFLAAPYYNPLTGVAAYNWHGTRVVAVHLADGSISLYTSTDGTTWTGPALVTTGTVTDSELTLSAMYVDPARYGGASEVLGIFYIRPYGSGAPRHEWHSTTNLTSFTGRGPVLGAGGIGVLGGYAPSVAVWPNRTSGGMAVRPDIGFACGAFPVASGAARLVQVMCYDRVTDTWVDKTGPWRSSWARRPAIAFHTRRFSTGVTDADAMSAAPAACTDGTCGQFYVASSNVNMDDSWLSISTALTEYSTPYSGFTFRDMDFFWAYNRGDAGIALYEDASLSALKAVLRFEPKPGPMALYGLGVADGTYRLTKTDGDDYQVMERAICRGLHGDGPRCGGLNVFGY